MIKKVIFVTYEMIPFSKYWGACQRVYYFADYLTRNHFDVKVFASKNTLVENNYDKPVYFEVIHFNNNYIDSNSPINTTHELESFTKTDNQVILSFKERFKSYFKKLDYQLNNEPNPGMGFISGLWIIKNKGSILSYLKSESDVHVIISIPPFKLANENFIKSIKSIINGKLILDYRDPWNCWNNRSGYSFRKEKRILKYADYVTTTTEAHRFKLIEDFDIHQESVKVLMNGYDNSLWSSICDYCPDKKDSKFIFSYIGSISFSENSYRNPLSLLKAFEAFEHKDKIKLRFIGVHDATLRDSTFKSSYPEIELIGRVNQIDSFKYMLDSDVLINIHTSDDLSSRYLVGGKFFDYLRSGKVLLSINSIESFEHSFIKKHNIGYCVENNDEQILSTLNEVYHYLIEESNNSKGSSSLDLSTYERDNQNSLLISLLK